MTGSNLTLHRYHVTAFLYYHGFFGNASTFLRFSQDFSGLNLSFKGWDSERYALEKGFPSLRVSDTETLNLQKSAKSCIKNTELASLRQLYF
jgi:hypothetical protein